MLVQVNLTRVVFYIENIKRCLRTVMFEDSHVENIKQMRKQTGNIILYYYLMVFIGHELFLRFLGCGADQPTGGTICVPDPIWWM